MDTMTSEHRFYLALAFVGLGAIYCVANIVRSVMLKKGFSDVTIKMYMVYILATLVAAIGVTGVVNGDAFTGLLGGLIGYALGNKSWEGAREA